MVVKSLATAVMLSVVSSICTVNANEIEDIFASLMISHANALKNNVDDSKAFISGLRELAKQQHREAQFVLGLQVMTGTIDAKEGMKWLIAADSNGCAGAGGILAMLYYSGEHVPGNDMIAFDWLRNAAEKGDTMSQFMLAGKYLNGDKEVKQDFLLAYSWSYQSSLSSMPPPNRFYVDLFMQKAAEQLTESDIANAKTAALDRIKRSEGIKTGLCMSSLPLQ